MLLALSHAKETTSMKMELTRALIVLFWSVTLVSSVFAQDGFAHPRIISVTGLAEIAVAPDEVRLTLGIDSHDKELALARANNDNRVKKLMALAHTAGVDPKNIQTSALTMGPEYSAEKIPKLLGYQVSQIVTLTLTDLSKYEALMTGSLQAGVNRVDGISFLVADSKKYRDEARLKAVRAAREKAKAMAAELGQTIGKPWEITEGADFDAQYVNANFSVRSKGMAMSEDEATVAGGEVTIRALVRVSFQLE
jgi:uncharacterized protein YggE